jgi:pantothenate kinase
VATGGGAFKFYDKLKEALDVNILREEEMECLIIGRCSDDRKWTFSRQFR